MLFRSVTIVAFGTSLPELLVSIISSSQGYNDLALGNIVGSNISNIGLVLAISTFIFYYALKTDIAPDEDANNDSYVMFLAVLLLFFFSRDKLISQIEGIVFFALYIAYIFWLYKRNVGGEVNQDDSATSTSSLDVSNNLSMFDLCSIIGSAKILEKLCQML